MAARAMTHQLGSLHETLIDCCTCVERFQLVSGDFGIVHALEERCDAGVILAPEVICDCVQD